MSNAPADEGNDRPTSSTAEHALHTTVDMPFEDAVPFVQLEHELADFETVEVTRLDRMIEITLQEEVAQTALLVVCHPEIARDALTISPTLAGMLPCTTVVYETTDPTEPVHVHHVSATRAMRDLGLTPEDAAPAVQALIEKTGELMDVVWSNIEVHRPATTNETPDGHASE